MTSFADNFWVNIYFNSFCQNYFGIESRFLFFLDMQPVDAPEPLQGLLQKNVEGSTFGERFTKLKSFGFMLPNNAFPIDLLTLLC